MEIDAEYIDTSSLESQRDSVRALPPWFPSGITVALTINVTGRSTTSANE